MLEEDVIGDASGEAEGGNVEAFTQGTRIELETSVADAAFGDEVGRPDGGEGDEGAVGWIGTERARWEGGVEGDLGGVFEFATAVATVDAVAVVDHVVDASEPGVGVADGFADAEVVVEKRCAFALTIGIAPERDDFGGDGVDALGGDAVAGEGIADDSAIGAGAGGGVVVNANLVAEAIEGLREVALSLESGGDGEEGLVWAALAGAFVDGIPEGAVADDLTAGTGTEFVALEEALGDAVAVVLPTVGIEAIVAEEFEKDAVEFVGAGLGGDVDDATGGATEFGGVSGGFYFEFADGFDRDGVGVAGFGGASGFASVDEYTVLLGEAAVDLRGG